MAPQFNKIGGVSTQSVHKCTGKHWDEWVAALDKAGARDWTHKEIVAHLAKKHRLSLWWRQGVTTGYEIAIGRREPGQNQKGHYQMTVTRSFLVSAARAWRALLLPAAQNIWLMPTVPEKLKVGHVFETVDGFYGEVRTIKVGRAIRFKWLHPDWTRPTTVQLYVVPRSKDKCILVIDHGGIKDAKTRLELRERWRPAIDALVLD